MAVEQDSAPGALSPEGGRRDPLGLVLTGGGARAAYQVGALAAIAEAVPDLGFPIVTGVSAGAINAAFLAAHPGPFAAAMAALRAEWSRLTAERVYRLRPARWVRAVLRCVGAPARRRSARAPLVRGVFDPQPLRALLAQRLDFAGIDRNIAAGGLRAVALSATSYATGETVTFVHGAPGVPLWRRALRHAVRARLTVDHVLASAALPLLFPAVAVDGEFYGDGSVRQTAPLAPAIHLGAQALVVVTTRGPAGARGEGPAAYPSVAEIGQLVLHAIFLDALEADIERLERLNRLLASLPAGVTPPDGLRRVGLLWLRPSRDLGALAAGRHARLPPIVRWLVRRAGGHRASAVEFLSYVLFDPAYTAALMDLGYDDARRDWPRLERFFAAAAP
jgi:NTE family protein